MASIKDAFEESIQDHNAILKYILFAIPVYYCTHLYMNSSKGDLTAFWVFSFLTYILLFGFMAKCTANVQNGEDHVLPSFNVASIFWEGIKGTIALGPSIAVNCWLAMYVCGWIETYIPEPNTLMAFKFAIWGLFISIIFTGYLCYARNFKITDAYNFKVISESCADILIAMIFMVPQILAADALVVSPVTYIIWLFFGLPHPIAIFFWCAVGVFNLAMIGHYLAQIAYENITTKENNNKII